MIKAVPPFLSLIAYVPISLSYILYHMFENKSRNLLFFALRDIEFVIGECANES